VISEMIGWFTDPATWQGPGGVPVRIAQHVGFVALSLLIATAVAVPVGLYVGHTGHGSTVLVGTGNAIRALPTLGLVTLLFLLVSDSTVAAVIGLVVLAVPPILAGTYAGLRAVDRRVVDAAEGMGMRQGQRLWQVEIPMALPLLLGGVRNAVLQLVATTAVAAYVGLGGLGRFLLDGLAVFDYGEVAGGAIITAALAITLDLALLVAQRAVVPRGVRLAEASSRSGNKEVMP
jgi:osmoprotectant transport system permease protein